MKMDFVIDWLEFTYLCPENLAGCSVFENFLDEFPEFEALLEEMVLLERGRNGYTQVYAFTDEFTISYNPDEERLGVHVTFPAHGLYRIMQIFGLDDISEYADASALMFILKSRGCRISRMDLAYDDFTKTFTPHDFACWKMTGRISTQCKVCGFMMSEATKGGTFYLGKRGKGRFLRIYDKEYESKGVINSIRYEFELRQEWATLIQDKILADVDFSVADLIEGMFTVTNEYERSDNADYNRVLKSRAGVDEKWQLFLDSIRTIRERHLEVKVCNVKQHNSFDKKEEWIKTQVLPTLFMFSEVVGMDKLLEMIESAGTVLKPLQRQMLKKYQYEYYERCLEQFEIKE